MFIKAQMVLDYDGKKAGETVASKSNLLQLLFLALSITYLFIPSFASAQPTVWDAIRFQFQLNHEINQPEVQTQLRWLIAHPNYLQQLTKSEPYIYHIITEIRKRNMPGELALLPLIESAFDPFAYSVVGAAGIWQLMPGTGSDLGLQQDWWFDARRSIRSSTDAALNYLNYLHHNFNGNWIFAIAAYDYGPAAVTRAIKNSKQPSTNIQFWRLPVPSETRAYVPRLLALAEIINSPQRYGITLPDIPHAPYFQEVNIDSQIDLNHAAKLAGISYNELIKLNPGYNHWTTIPNQSFKLLIPANKVTDFNRNLAHIPQENRVSWVKHQVNSGESLESIAQHYLTNVKLIRELNQLHSKKLKLGQFLLIPNNRNTEISTRNRPIVLALHTTQTTLETYKILHIVQPGETLQTIENRYHVSQDNIEQWNNIKTNGSVYRGQQLIIWKNAVKRGTYVVKAGDSLNQIAKQFNANAVNLARLNPQLNLNLLQPGQQLNIG